MRLPKGNPSSSPDQRKQGGVCNRSTTSVIVALSTEQLSPQHQSPDLVRNCFLHFLTRNDLPRLGYLTVLPVRTSSQTVALRSTNTSGGTYLLVSVLKKTSQTSRCHCRRSGHSASYHQIKYYVRDIRDYSRYFPFEYRPGQDGLITSL